LGFESTTGLKDSTASSAFLEVLAGSGAAYFAGMLLIGSSFFELDPRFGLAPPFLINETNNGSSEGETPAFFATSVLLKGVSFKFASGKNMDSV